MACIKIFWNATFLAFDKQKRGKIVLEEVEACFQGSWQCCLNRKQGESCFAMKGHSEKYANCKARIGLAKAIEKPKKETLE